MVMEYRRLGSSGLKVSALSYGAWVTFGGQVNLELSKQLMVTCRDAGVNFFDNAEVYGNGAAETIMGQAFKELGWKRSDLVISTKIFWGGSGPNDSGLSRKHIIEGTKASLERLQMDYVDLLYCHRPDPNTPMIETIRAMNYCIDKGMALYWGTSEWTAPQLLEAHTISEKLGLIPPSVEQPEYNMFNREKVEKDYLEAGLYNYNSSNGLYGMGLTTWSPLASGLLTGKYKGGIAPAGSRLALEEFKVSSVIMGATKVSQLEDNLGALDIAAKMNGHIMQRIDTILKNKPAAAAAV
ncbi:MAG: hypothetical protein WDW38_001066 [Sanguina aurantia]